MNEQVPKFESKQDDPIIELANSLAETEGVIKEWKSINDLSFGGRHHFAMTESMSSQFEALLFNLGYEVNRGGKHGWEIRSRR
jgi:hypothetical protein